MMFFPIESKKPKLESCCIICSKDSCRGDNNGELTSIFLNYFFPPADTEEISIELLPLLTFCNNCGSILDELLELHKSLEHIQNNIKNTVKNVKCSILKTGDDGKIMDGNVRKIRKIATRDYCPRVVLEKGDAYFSKEGPFENNIKIQMSNNTNVHYGQLKRDSIIVEDRCSTSVDIFKSPKRNSCDNRRNRLETSQYNETTLTPFSTDFDAVDYNQEAVQSNPKLNEIGSGHEFSRQQSAIRSAEVIIQMQPNFSFAEEEGTVKFEPWNQSNQEEQDLQHASQEQNMIIEDLQNIHSDDHNGSNTLSLSDIGDTDISQTKKYGSPPFTFAQMIFIAITNSANRSATPETIYEFIVNIFPFYKYYHLKKIACQLLTECSAFEEANPKPNNMFLPPLPQVYVVKRCAVSDFVNQIKIKITMCGAPPSDYMINPDHYLKSALDNDYSREVPATTRTVNYSNEALITNEGEEKTPQEIENDGAEIVKEVSSRAPTYKEPLVSSTAMESNNHRTFNKPPLTHPIMAAIVVAYSDNNGLIFRAIWELMWKRFPFYEDQKDTFPKRLYSILKNSRFFVQKIHGGLPFPLFHLNTENDEAIKELKKEFRKFLLITPEHICQYIANPHEMEARARKILGTDMDFDLTKNLQLLCNYISQKYKCHH